MSGAQGAKTPEEKTATTYESLPGGENRTKTDLYSKEDQGSIQVDKVDDKVSDPVGKVNPTVFGDIDKEEDPGVTGTAGEYI